HQVEGERSHFVGTSVFAVDLVDDDDGLEAAGQRLAQHEARLWHGALGGVYQQQHSVDHRQGAFYLAAEVSVPWGVHDVDLLAVPQHGGVLGEDGDTTLSFDSVAVHDALFHDLVGTEDIGLAQHAVDEGRLAVVDVRYDGDVSVVHLLLRGLGARHVR